MLIITATALFLYFGMGGGTTLEDVQQAIGENVGDETRASHAIARVDRLRQDRATLRQDVADVRRQILALDESHDATAARYREILDQLDRIRSAQEERELASRFELKDDLTRSEWAAIFPAPK